MAPIDVPASPSVPEASLDVTRRRIDVLGTRIDITSYEDAGNRVRRWIEEGVGRMICAANVHMVMEGQGNLEFQAIVNDADLVTADGMPLVWCLRRWGASGQERVYGPDLMAHLLQIACERRWRVGFYGGEEAKLDRLVERVSAKYAGITLGYTYSPPFRLLSEEEESVIRGEIVAADIQLLFVGLGCPKQEQWMSRQKYGLNCVMVGVGAAFAFHAGTVRNAPAYLKRLGLEWLYRLAMEPRRLWRRYAKHNPRFVVMALRSGLTRRNIPLP